MRNILHDAIVADPKTIDNTQQKVEEKAEEIVKSVKGKFSWVRGLFASSILIIILIAAIHTGSQGESLKELYTILLHSFELLLGAFIGLLTGEALNR